MVVRFHEAAPLVNENLCSASTQASIRILGSQFQLGSMQVEFGVEVLPSKSRAEAQADYRSHRKLGFDDNSTSCKLTSQTILEKGFR